MANPINAKIMGKLKDWMYHTHQNKQDDLGMEVKNGKRKNSNVKTA